MTPHEQAAAIVQQAVESPIDFLLNPTGLLAAIEAAITEAREDERKQVLETMEFPTITQSTGPVTIKMEKRSKEPLELEQKYAVDKVPMDHGARYRVVYMDSSGSKVEVIGFNRLDVAEDFTAVLNLGAKRESS